MGTSVIHIRRQYLDVLLMVGLLGYAWAAKAGRQDKPLRFS